MLPNIKKNIFLAALIYKNVMANQSIPTFFQNEAILENNETTCLSNRLEKPMLQHVCIALSVDVYVGCSLVFKEI